MIKSSKKKPVKELLLLYYISILLHNIIYNIKF